MHKKFASKAGKSHSAKGPLERVPTGIPGLDKLMCGGIPKGTTTLITGATGTGKTIFQLQFLWEGLQRGERVLFITLEESPEDIKADGLQFGWDFEKYEKNEQFGIVAYEPFEISSTNMRLRELIINRNYTRLAIDSTSLLGMYTKDDYKVRKGLYAVISTIKSTGCTAIISAEIPEDSKALSRFGVEEFVVDGVIVLTYMSIGEITRRGIQIRKMRRTKHTGEINTLEFCNAGLRVTR